MGKQQDFFKENRKCAPNRIIHGDESCVGKRKLARPFRRHGAIHLILKSESAKGARNLRTAKNQVAVERILARQSAKFAVKIHKDQNVGSHLHLIVSCGRRENFLRAVAGMIARAVLEGKSGRFWTQPPFTRLISGQRDYLSMLNYLQKNFIEAVFGQDARRELEEIEVQVRKERRRKLAKSRRSASVQPNR